MGFCRGKREGCEDEKLPDVHSIKVWYKHMGQ